MSPVRPRTNWLQSPAQPIPPERGRPAPIGDGIVVLRRVHRFGGAIAELAEAIQRGDADAVLTVLGRGDSNVHWIPVDATQPAALDASARRAPARRRRRPSRH